MKKNLPDLAMRGKQLVIVAILLTFSLDGIAQARLLKDINPDEDVLWNEFAALTASTDKVYFIANGNELWKTTGNAGGTVRVRPFETISNLTPLGNILFFSADDGSGPALWRTTGTYASTVKVKSFDGLPSWLTAVGNVIYFSAGASPHGTELWKSDGTNAGTVLVKDIRPGKMGSDPAWITWCGELIYFTANDGKSGHELWKTDGTPVGTVLVRDLREGTYLGSIPRNLTNANGTLFFTAFDGVTGRELYRCDGTTEGTVRLRDIRPGAQDPGIGNLTAVNNTLFFTANDGVHGHELWKSDGSEAGTVLVKDMTPGWNGSHGGHPFTFPMGNFKALSGLLYYTAYQRDTYYVWKSDGTEAGTVPLFVSSHAIGPPVPRFISMGKSIYYFDMSEDENSYYEFHLYRMNADGSNPTIVTSLVIPDFYSVYHPELVTLHNTLYFWGRDDHAQGFKLFRSNGTKESSRVIRDVSSAGSGSAPRAFTRWNDKVLFVAEEEPYEPDMWITDGTTAGTHRLPHVGNPQAWAVTSAWLYYTRGFGLEIWRTDGTEEGTSLVIQDQTVSAADWLVAVNDLVFFQTYEQDLWRTDGTEAGSFRLLQGRTPWRESVNNNLIFAVDGDNGLLELWRSNGTPEGTYRLYDFPGDDRAHILPRIVEDNILYFVANDGTHRDQVWRTDGTTGGTWRITDLPAGANNDLNIRSLGVWNDDLYISARDDQGTWSLYRVAKSGGTLVKVRDMDAIDRMISTDYRLHLFVETEGFRRVNHWVTDGTADGTEQISDESLSSDISWSLVDGLLYLNAWGSGLWRSDGTRCGTFGIDLNIDAIQDIQRLGDQLIFSARSTQYGFEPFAYRLADTPKSPCGPPTPDMSTARIDAASVILSIYPNPFSEEFSFSIPGTARDHIQLQVFSASGMPIESFPELKANSSYRIGRSWKPGNYILRINVSGNVTSQQVLKE